MHAARTRLPVLLKLKRDNPSMRKNSGFTLIELVMVIVIIGILAVNAMPKFIDLKSSAQAAALNSMAATVQTAATMAHLKQQAAGLGPNDPITVDGVSVGMLGGYPTELSIGSLVDYSGFTFRTDWTGWFLWNDIWDCRVDYNQVGSSFNPTPDAPGVTILDTGC